MAKGLNAMKIGFFPGVYFYKKQRQVHIDEPDVQDIRLYLPMDPTVIAKLYLLIW